MKCLNYSFCTGAGADIALGKPHCHVVAGICCDETRYREKIGSHRHSQGSQVLLKRGGVAYFFLGDNILALVQLLEFIESCIRCEYLFFDIA
jgi:hypothetical protein